MRKILNITLIIILLTSLIILTGCDNTEETVIEYKVPTIIDRTNSKLQTDEDIEYEIKKGSQNYFEMLYGTSIFDARFKNIYIYRGDEDDMKYVDLAENDYAFQMDYEIKPSSENDIEELSKYFGKYDEESGWFKECHGYGVMRYNEISDEYDVTSITPDGF